MYTTCEPSSCAYKDGFLEVQIKGRPLFGGGRRGRTHTWNGLRRSLRTLFSFNHLSSLQSTKEMNGTHILSLCSIDFPVVVLEFQKAYFGALTATAPADGCPFHLWLGQISLPIPHIYIICPYLVALTFTLRFFLLRAKCPLCEMRQICSSPSSLSITKP